MNGVRAVTRARFRCAGPGHRVRNVRQSAAVTRDPLHWPSPGLFLPIQVDLAQSHHLCVVITSRSRSGFTLTDSGWARWGYEPAAGPGAGAATLAAIIVHILGAPHTADSTPGADAYRAFPVKGAAGRCLQDRGLTVTLQVSEDWESFEATTEIEVTSPARPWLGAVRLADDGHLDWGCDYRAAFHGDPGHLADVIGPILRADPGTRLRPIPLTAS